MCTEGRWRTAQWCCRYVPPFPSSLFFPFLSSFSLTSPARSQSYLTDRDPRQISDAGLLYLARDVRWLVQHVASLQNERLNDVFGELSQVRLLRFFPSLPLLDTGRDRRGRLMRSSDAFNS